MYLSRALLEGEQLLGAERLVVDLRGGVDQILEVSAGEEIAEVDEFAVLLVLDVDGSPAVLASANGLAVNIDVALASDDGERDDGLGLEISGLLLPEYLLQLTLICEFMATSSLSYSSFSYGYMRMLWKANSSLMRSLKICLSSKVRLSALAMTGTTLTVSLSFFNTTMSIGLSACPVGVMKYKQQWMRVS